MQIPVIIFLEGYFDSDMSHVAHVVLSCDGRGAGMSVSCLCRQESSENQGDCPLYGGTYTAAGTG